MNTTDLNLTIGYITFKSLVDEVIHPDGRITFEGMMASLLDALQKNMKFTYVLLKAPGNKIGIQDPNGTWNGLIGIVSRGEADISILGLITTYPRAQVVEFSTTYTFSPTYILSGQRKGHQDNAKDIVANMAAFDGKIWMNLLICSFLFIFISALARNIRATSVSEFWSGILRTSVKYCITMFGILTQRGPNVRPRTGTEKIMLTIYAFASLMVIIFLSTDFCTDLVSPPSFKFPESREELLKSKRFKPAIYDGNAFERMIRASETGIYADIKNRIESGDGVVIKKDELLSLETLDQLASGKVSFIGPSATVAVLSGELCSKRPDVLQHFSKETFYVSPVAIFYNKLLDINVRKKMNNVILRLIEAGILPLWREKAVAIDARCFTIDADQTEERSVQMGHLMDLFVVTCGGFLASAIALFAEICWEKLTNRSCHKKPLSPI